MFLRKFKLAMFNVICCFLASCATTPISNELAAEVKSENIINSAMTIPKHGYGVVIVKRDRGLNTSACKSRIFVNGQPVADIAPGEKITIFLPHGDQLLGAKATGICAGGLVEIKTNVTDKTSTFRVSYGTWGEFSIQPTAF